MRRLILAGMSCLAVLCVVRAQEGPSSAPDTKTPAAPAPKSEEPPAAPSPRAGEPKLDTLTLRETRPCVFSPRIPAEYLRDHQAKQLATARLSLDLDKAGVLELAYGEERTQAPVIAAFVDEKESESKLDTELYRSRADRSMLLVFTVKSAPKNFGAYTLLIEHTQVNEAGEQAVKSMQFHNLETFTRQRVTIPGMLPGVNRLCLKVRFTDDNKVTTTSDGISHFVTVNEVPALALSTETKAETNVKKAQGVGVYEALLTTTHTFILSPSVDPASVRLRVLRRGSRGFDLDGVDTDVRDLIGQPVYQKSARLLAEVKLANEAAPGVRVENMGQRRYRVTVEHALSATESLMPLTDEWEYLFELRHKDHNDAIDSFSHSVGALLDTDVAYVTYKNRAGADVVRVPFKPAE